MHSDFGGNQQDMQRVTRVSAELQARMRGRSWHPDPRCPSFEALRLVTIPYRDFAGQVRSGQLVVASELADEVVVIFERLFAVGFPIERMELIDAYDGDDDASMAANNTSGFNFRRVVGTEVLSRHAFGQAIDINPRLNPMIVPASDGDRIYPPAGAEHVDRSSPRPGMITRPGPVVELFEAHGWQWGGDWSPMRDYHHFVKNNGGAPRGTPPTE